MRSKAETQRAKRILSMCYNETKLEVYLWSLNALQWADNDGASGALFSEMLEKAERIGKQFLAGNSQN